MKVKKLIEILKKENQDSEIYVYLGAKEGWEIVNFGSGDAIIGHGKTPEGSKFVLLPVSVPPKLKEWNKK